jgi:chromosome partitioning protein
MQQPIVFAMMCHKGGTGKTTSVSGLADVFASEGKKVLIVDADEQSNIKTIFGIKLQNSEGGLAAILLNNVNPESLTCKVRENVDVILSGGRFMRDFEKVHANTPDAELLFSRRFEGLTGYDIVLIDTPPALSLISTNVVAYADYLLLPCSPDLLAVVGVKNTLNFIENIEGHFKTRGLPIAKVMGVIPTMHDGRRNLDMDILDDLQRLEDADLLRGGRVFPPIRNDIKVKTAQVKRKLLSETFPNAKATEDYAQVGKMILALIAPVKSETLKAQAGQLKRPPEASM